MLQLLEILNVFQYNFHTNFYKNENLCQKTVVPLFS